MIIVQTPYRDHFQRSMTIVQTPYQARLVFMTFDLASNEVNSFSKKSLATLKLSFCTVKVSPVT